MNEACFKQLVYLQLLLNTEGIGPARILYLKSKFVDFEKIFNSDFNSLEKMDWIGSSLANKIFKSIDNYCNTKDYVEKELSKLDKIGGTLITLWEDNYPECLKNIYLPPLYIYTLGHFHNSDKDSVSIVGTRNPTTYGKLQTEIFASDFAGRGITIVSGLARGIDTIAHKSSLNNNGRTIAVIGSGLDIIYPGENKKLFQEIRENGLIITEYPFGTKPDAQNFPRRNRIISGLSLGTLVVETKINGGAMQTAAYALDQDREVFAIPGNIDSKQSEGTNLLIQKGEAKLVKEPEDVLVELQLKLKPEVGKNIPKPSINLNFFEEKIMEILVNNPLHIDDIASKVSMSTQDCLVNLLSLEFKGLVNQLPGKTFARISY